MDVTWSRWNHSIMRYDVKTRSAFLSLYAALTPALASAKCGNVDYSWGADVPVSAHDYAVTMMLYIVYLCYAVAGIVVIVSALQIYIKDEYGRRRSEEEHPDAGGSLPVPHRTTIVFPTFFGYQI